MLNLLPLVVSPPDSNLLYMGHYDPILVGLSIIVAILASYAALLVAQHVSTARAAKTRRRWLMLGGLCMGIGIWTMHFVGMLAFSLPCGSRYDPVVTVLSMIPGILASILALNIASRPSLTRGQLAAGGLLFGAGIGAMHYSGMAAMHIDGLIRYDLKLFLVSILVAVVLATLAIWLRYRLQVRQAQSGVWTLIVSAAAMGLAVSGMHYTGMAAAYFISDGDGSIVDSQITPTFLASMVLAATGALIVLTMAASYVARPNLFSIGRYYKMASLLTIGWLTVAWLSADYYADRVAGDQYRQAQLAKQQMDRGAGNIDIIQVRSNAERVWVFLLLAVAGGMLIVATSAIIFYLRASKRAAADLRVAAAAFEVQEGMMVTDPRGVILRVNKAFTEITGYLAEEAVGETPRLLRSDRHDGDFYAAIWAAVGRTGAWQGEIWNRRKDGETYPGWLTITAVNGADGEVINYVGTLVDISQRKAAEDAIEKLAFFDTLTGLPNRRLLTDRLNQAMMVGARSGRGGALLFIDLDNFKAINDTLGHHKGDQLLKQVAERLVGSVREGDSVARFGGDEFVVLLENLSDKLETAAAQTRMVADKILTTLNRNYQLENCRYYSSSSIGAAMFSGNDIALEELLKQADLAMYQAKAAGRNVMRFFDSAMQTAVNTRAALEADLRQGLQRNEFCLYYQPQVDCTGHLTGVEALVRWRHPERGLVLPDTFIPLAEDTRLILPLGHWVLETACAQLAVWATRPESARLTMAVNVSARQFRHPDFVEQVQAIVERTAIDPSRLKLEITESLLLDDIEDVIAKMAALKDSGIGFSLDDFGTGYSSLAYLKRLPLDQLKIDRSFVRDVLTDPNDAAIARAIMTLARSLDLSVIAEGVETEAQRDLLYESGCATYQGYLFGKPAPIEAIEPFLVYG
ncbi:MAG: PAS domain S-box protein [Hydrogenophilales bacterium CG03_land_8_20_14_0_80_62_28]|nr:EAL domain-containing protein [Betaproteobacteria bacterium]OIO77747.1 MAG: hypothetical protein AUJ86_07910 [Hydrogenophilaceae bacterium CG1_02_62_390]PIV24727.1 MAG: PAS domain S-box protein [Hydrogenophilales bacterium CG03_land_8_20_14_0_80_62_28]PIW38499.1 MAG: PAS domain S-box protein [Hydrogenophilales bacterium CG15_BIG_FIL_POST_REV_8_21_14_020_62_31]PIW71250.1 MAG: PAS domain S-box protein [Hydrogenophilales bacterium CG12_big_fil_rev_8_21_14_0_65_61_21]PIX02609.1 MAG: PAS domain 